MMVPIFFFDNPYHESDSQLVYLWRGNYTPAPQLTRCDWITIDIDRKHFQQIQTVTFPLNSWEHSFVGRLDRYYLVDILDEVLLTCDDKRLRNWALQQIKNKEGQHVHSA